MSRIIESLRGDLAKLQEAGAIGKVTMREFDAICPPPVREFTAADIKRLREGLKFSQPVFAHHLHTTASTVRKWEQGETRPTGSRLSEDGRRSQPDCTSCMTSSIRRGSTPRLRKPSTRRCAGP